MIPVQSSPAQITSTVNTPSNPNNSVSSASFQGRSLSAQNVNSHFCSVFKVDEAGNPLPTGKFEKCSFSGEDYELGHLSTTFNQPEDRKPLEDFIVTILDSKELMTKLKQDNKTFARVLAEHSKNGELPPKEDWHSHQSEQTCSHKDQTWLSSFAMSTLLYFHH